MSFDYKISIVIPVYNSAKCLPICMKSVFGQKNPGSFEVVLINDGSTDDSLSVCREYEKAHDNVVVIDRENGGVSAARNTGILASRGEYIMFLDADDTLESETVGNVARFFDTCREETDLVTYPLANDKGRVKTVDHYRHLYMKKSGVYSLKEYPFVTQSTINVVVKNKGKDSLLFDTTLQITEDHTYITEQLCEKATIGYCAQGQYNYVKNGSNATNAVALPYYTFSQLCRFFDHMQELIEQYPDMDEYIQVLIMHNIAYRFRREQLFLRSPREQEEKEALETLKKYVTRLDDKIIMGYPDLDETAKAYFISMKNDSDVSACVEDGKLVFKNKGVKVFTEDMVTLMVTKIAASGENVILAGAIESPVAAVAGNVELTMYVDDEPKKLELRPSTQSYYKRTRICNTLGFYDKVSITGANELHFEMKIDGSEVKTKLRYLMPKTGINRFFCHCFRVGDKRLVIDYDKIHILTPSQAKEAYKKDNKRTLKTDKAAWAFRKAAFLTRNMHIWLYCDVKNEPKGDAYLQYQHDKDIKDGIKRYYVTPYKIKKYFPGEKNIIPFGNIKHCMLFAGVEKVIVSCEEHNFMPPFAEKHYSKYAGASKQPIFVRLPAGVDCARKPWIRGVDCQLSCAEVISTDSEYQLLHDEYGQPDQTLISCGLPHFDKLNKDGAQKKILFAPTWRKYLVGISRLKPVRADSRFLSSDYYKNTSEFLKSEKLAGILKKYGYTLDFRLHPMLRGYNGQYKNLAEGVTVSDARDISEYAAVITDFSSLLYDFAYMSRPVLMWGIDDSVKYGLHTFDDPNVPEKYISAKCETADELLDALEKTLSGQIKSASSDGFYADGNCMDKLYKAVKEM